jgi:hypothetical protein
MSYKLLQINNKENQGFLFINEEEFKEFNKKILSDKKITLRFTSYTSETNSLSNFIKKLNISLTTIDSVEFYNLQKLLKLEDNQLEFGNKKYLNLILHELDIRKFF